jgi:predicted DNA-binding transcriptional regulator YafY
MTGRELSKRLEVSLRTIHRDMEALSAAGVPIYALRGSGGGWQLDEDWRTQVPGLDEAELGALLMAQPRTLGNVRLAAAAESALAKLVAALPAAMRERASSIRQRLYIDPDGWSGWTENLSMLPVVQDAVAKSRKLWMRYRAAGETETERTVDPIGLVAKGSAWYVYAVTPRGHRTYRVSRIIAAKLLDIPCARPTNFDLAASWRAAAKRYQNERQQYRVKLRADAKARMLVRMWLGEGPVKTMSESEGVFELSVGFETEEQACALVLALGPHAEALEPIALRKKAAVWAQELVRKYSD